MKIATRLPQEYFKLYYYYSGWQSIQAGLFLFFLPVWLWQKYQSLTIVSYFIITVTIGYLLGLLCWERCYKKQVLTFPQLSTVSLYLGIIPVLCLAFYQAPLSLFLMGISVGIFNAFWWTYQRVLFVAITTHKNSGNHYGNTQILIGFLIQIGLLLGGLLLQKQYYNELLLLSIMLVIVASLHLRRFFQKYWEEAISKPLKLRQIIGFKDKHKSRTIFIVDGLFLFIETYFWAISLFILLNKNIMVFSWVVTALFIIFAILFWVIKKHVDKIKTNHVFILSTVLYATSWLVRLLFDMPTNTSITATYLIYISFCTLFFRLTFNKRFIDVAKSHKTMASVDYVLMKSFWTQGVILILFLTIAFVSTYVDPMQLIKYCYVGAFLLSFLFATYRVPNQ